LSSLYAQSPRLLRAVDDVRTSIAKNKAFWIKFEGIEKIKFDGPVFAQLDPDMA
jgi:hypothetical protein